MRILSVEPHDYLSFRECPPIHFGEGINLVVGMNNSGKSSLLKAMVPELPAEANRDSERYQAVEIPQPLVTLKVKTTGRRFEETALMNGSCQIPVQEVQAAEEEARAFFRMPHIEILLKHHGGNRFERTYPGHGLFEPISYSLGNMPNPRLLVVFQKKTAGWNVWQ